MNENEIKSQLYQKYSKELEETGTSKRDFFRFPLAMAADTIDFIFDSKGLKSPPDVLKHITNNLSKNQDISSSNDKNDDSDDSLQKAIQASKEEFNRQQTPSTEIKPLNLPNFDISKFRYLNTDEETASQRGISCAELLEHRKELTRDLVTFDDIVGVRYKDSILEELKKINNQPKDGIIISVLLHTGDRISKIFDSEDTGSSIYYWTASQDKMIRDNIKPRHFIVIKNNGDEIIPNMPIKDQIAEKQMLLNVRLL